MRKFLILFLILPFLSACNSNETKPTGLMVEFIRETKHVYVLDARPEFTWIVPDNFKNQAAYQILVASSKANLKEKSTDVWNSGKVNDNQSVELEYKGPELEDTISYYWKVRVWGSDENKPSPYSAIHSFQTGIIKGYNTSADKIQSILIEPQKMIETKSGHYFIDFGKDAFGQLVLELNSKTNDTIVVHLGEKLSEPGIIDMDPEGSIRYQKIILPVQKGEGIYLVQPARNKRNTSGAAVLLADSVGIVMPFRYAEIEQLKSDINLNSIWQKAYFYYFDDNASYFTSSDTLLNQIWDLCRYSIKATSFTGLYIDGDRERIPYEGDAYINQMGHYYVDRSYSMARRTNEYFIKHPTWPTEWILHTVPMFYYDYMYTGNPESVIYYYKNLKDKTLMALAREDGLISSKNASKKLMKKLGFSNPDSKLQDLVDWPPGQKDTGWKLETPQGERDGYEMLEINTVVNAFYYHNLKLMSELAGYLNKEEDAIFYNQKAEQVKASINDKLFDKNRGVYVDGENSQHASLHANMMPLAFGLVPQEYISTVVAFIKSRGMACSVYGAQYLMEGLYAAGEAAYAFDLLTSTSDRSWYNMIRSGSTISMEAWDMKYKPNSDWNHAWGAVPANIIPRSLWGIQPTKPGFSQAIIKPQLGELNYAKIKVPTIRGFIKAEFKTNGNKREFNIQIPPNMHCEFLIPSQYEKMTVTHNKTEIKDSESMLVLISGLNEIIFE